MALVDFVARVVFGVASIALMLLSAALITYAGLQVYGASYAPEGDVGAALLEAVGYTIISIAVFDVAKYILEEEAVRAREMRHAGEARRSMTKFISTIAIAVFLEALVSVFEASKEDVRMMLYPTLLLFGGVTLMVGLGIYQRLSVSVENEVGGSRGEARDEAAAEDAAEKKRNEDASESSAPFPEPGKGLEK